MAFQLAYQLTKLNWVVQVITPQFFSEQDEINAFNAGLPFSVKQLRLIGPAIFEGIYRFHKGYEAIRKQNPAIILAVGEQAVWVGAILALVTKRPFLAIGVGTEFVRGGRLRKWLTRWAFNMAERRVAISHYTKSLMEEQGIATKKSVVIHCGADGDLTRDAQPDGGSTQIRSPEVEKVILTVGQVSKRKAHDIVIRALPQIAQTCPRVTYLIAGLPTEQQRLEALAEELGVASKVIFLGKVASRDLARIYKQADVFVLVSRPSTNAEVEGFGIVVLEAAMWGIPAVVSDFSGLAETVIDGVTGLIVEPENPKTTADAISRLLLDDALRKKMGLAARNYALENATWEKRIGQYDQLMRDILEQ